MNGIFSKVLIGVSLAVVLALGIPLTMMTLSVLHGESPRQRVEQEQQTAAEPSDDAAAPEGQDVQPAQTFPYPKPVVQPDPGSPAEEPEEVSQEETVSSAPVQRSGRTKQKTQSPAPSPNQNQTTTPAAPTEETAKPKNTLPKAVLAPGEAPCMVDGLDGYLYDY